MDTPLISIVVPVRNGAPSLRACVEALLAQTLPRSQYEVIVVDDGSTDDSLAIARSLGVTCLSIPHAGPVAARNHGARLARGDLLLFTDADCVPAPDWSETMLAAFADQNVAGAKGAYRTREPGLVPRFVQLEYLSKYERMSRMPRIDSVDTSSAAYRRAVFLANSGFDTAFPVPSVEDQEFSFRLARQGHRLIFVPEAIVYHRHDLNMLEYAQRKFQIGYWKVLLLRRHPGKAFADSYAPPSQRLQIGLLGIGLAALALSPVWSGAVAVLGLSAGGFALSALPFLAFVLRRDRVVAVIAPLMLLVRAAALGAGLAAGLLRQSLRALTSSMNVP